MYELVDSNGDKWIDNSKYFIVQMQPERTDELWAEIKKLNGVYDVWEHFMYQEG